MNQHAQRDLAICHALCHIVSHILAWLKISLREAEAQPLACWRAALQSRQQLPDHPGLVLSAVGHKLIIKETPALTPPTPQTLKPSPEQGVEMEDPGVPGFLWKGQGDQQKQQGRAAQKEFQVQNLGAVAPEKRRNGILGVVPSFWLAQLV